LINEKKLKSAAKVKLSHDLPNKLESAPCQNHPAIGISSWTNRLDKPKSCALFTQRSWIKTSGGSRRDCRAVYWPTTRYL